MLTPPSHPCRQRELGAEEAAGDGDALRAPAAEAVRAVGLCSDVLFQAHLCTATPLKPHWLERETVPRAAGLTQQQFADLYERCVSFDQAASAIDQSLNCAHPCRPGEPVILTNVVPHWPAFGAWDDAALEAAHGAHAVFAGGYSFALRDYLRYARAVTRDDAPLYLCAPLSAQAARNLRCFLTPGVAIPMFAGLIRRCWVRRRWAATTARRRR